MTAGIIGLVGPNEAGKTTLLTVLSGFLTPSCGLITLNGARLDLMICAGVCRPDTGRVTRNGHRIDHLPPDRVRASGIAIFPEGHRVLARLTVVENLHVAALGQPPRLAAQAVAATLWLFPELRADLHLLAGHLSGGQKQMVSFAQALLGQPKIRIIDESSLGLAPILVKRFIAALNTIAASGVGILLVEQLTALALSVADRTYLMDLGRPEFTGPAQDLIARQEILLGSYFAAAAK